MSRNRSMTLGNKVLRRLFLGEKSVYQYARSYIDQSYLSQRKILFIVGCQRSGTTLMQRIFEKDINTKIYDENSKLSSIEGIRLNPLHMVKAELRKDKAQFIVLKPLVESQNILKLLADFKDSKALWLFRDYKDVAASNLKLFGNRNGINNLRPIFENQPANWRSEGVSETTRKLILQYFSEDMNPYNAAVLFWYARNQLFFERQLSTNPKVLMCKYEHLITEPNSLMRSIYQGLGQRFPGEKITAEIHSGSLRKGKEIELSPAINDLAQDMLKRLDEVYLSKRSASRVAAT